jgi:hypothetical protein
MCNISEWFAQIDRFHLLYLARVFVNLFHYIIPEMFGSFGVQKFDY